MKVLVRIASFLALAATFFASNAAAQSASDGRAGAITGFGSAVAVEGDEIFVGRPGVVAFFPAPASQIGTVHIFRRGAVHGWTEADAIFTEQPSVGEGFGSALAVSGDVLVVAAPATDAGRGAVYVFQRGTDLEWAQTVRLQPEYVEPGNSFGFSVAVNGGDLMIGAPDRGENGVVFVYRRAIDGNGWDLVGQLEGEESAERFGASIAIQGNMALVGAPGPNVGFGGQPPDNPGAGYVLSKNDGTWTVSRRLTPSDESVRSMGTSVILSGGQALFGAPISARSVGSIVVFRANSAGVWAQTDVIVPEGLAAPAAFGLTLARAGDDIIATVPLAFGRGGGFFVYRWSDSEDEWLQTQAVQAPPSSGGFGAFGGLGLGAEGNVAVLGAPGDAFFEGMAHVYERDDAGQWQLSNSVFETDQAFTAVSGEEIDCADGMAADFTCSDVELMAYMPLNTIGGSRGMEMNDVWGWTDPETGKEWVIAGRFDGTSFVDISDPVNPVYVGNLPITAGANNNLWRDIKVYRNHAYIVADNAGEYGIQIFDLTQLRGLTGEDPVTFQESAHYSEINSAHNIVINEESGFAYVVGASGGGTTCGGGLHMVDIRDPENPTFAGCFQDTETGRVGTGYSHDAQCLIYRGPDESYQGHEICFGANETALSIADVTDKDSTIAVSHVSYPNVGYSHQGWISEDHKYFFLDDELDELSGVEKTRTLVWDVEDLDDPVLLTEYMGVTSSTDHNLYVRGNYMYQANYVSGLRIIDISDPANLREVGFFDTVPLGEDAPGFAGAFSTYPYFESGVVVVTSMREGLFVLKKRREQLVP